MVSYAKGIQLEQFAFEGKFPFELTGSDLETANQTIRFLFLKPFRDGNDVLRTPLSFIRGVDSSLRK